MTWDEEWNAVYLPWVIIEWKATRRGNCKQRFDDYDVDWLRRYTKKYPSVFGYVVTVDIREEKSHLHYAQIREGKLKRPTSL